MVVTEDQYELPLYICDSVKEVARISGVKEKTIVTQMWRHDKGVYKRTKYVKVRLDEGESDE